MNRRQLLKSTVAFRAAAGMSGAQPSSAQAAPSDRVRVGVIGCGNMGSKDQGDFQKMPEVDVVAVCDVDQSNALRAQQMTEGKARVYGDYRRVLDDKSIQAVIVATPDHWHAKITVDACDAGKDVYCEKPISNRIQEGRLMVEAVKRNNRVVQIGLQQRSGTHFQRAAEIVQKGELGTVRYIQCFLHMAEKQAQGGRPLAAEALPEGLDWDMWLGPAPQAPYSRTRQRNWRSYFDYGGGVIADWGVHLMDIALWAMNAGQPLSACCAGARFFAQDPKDFSRGDTPDSLVTLYEFPGFILQFSNMRHNSFGPNGNWGTKPFGAFGTLFHGTQGTLFVDRAGFELSPQLYGSADPNGKDYPRLTDDETGVNVLYAGERGAERASTSVQHYPHVRNFLDCVKSRQKPIADIESAFRVTATCHLGNISYKIGQKVSWDAESGKITNVPDANALVTRVYRSPWALKGL